MMQPAGEAQSDSRRPQRGFSVFIHFGVFALQVSESSNGTAAQTVPRTFLAKQLKESVAAHLQRSSLTPRPGTHALPWSVGWTSRALPTDRWT